MIKTENLCKSFGDIKAANNVSLTITDNSIFGLAGAERSRKKYSAAYAFRCIKAGQRKDCRGRQRGI